MLLWHIIINTEFSAFFGSSGLTSLVVLHSWCIHCTAPLMFYLKQTRTFYLLICGSGCPCLCLEEPHTWGLPGAVWEGLLPTSAGCGSDPDCALQRPVYSQDIKANVLERQGMFMCTVISTYIPLNSTEYLFKLRRFLSIAGIPWRKTNNPTCSENGTYFSLGKMICFQQYPAYWLKSTIYLKKKNWIFSAVPSVPWAVELWRSERLCGISKNNLPFSCSTGKCEPMQLAILADIWILNRRSMFLQNREITEAALHPLLVVVIISILILLANCWAGRLAHKLKILLMFCSSVQRFAIEKK